MTGFDLKRYRELLSLTQAQLSVKTGIPQPSIARYEATGIITKSDRMDALKKFFTKEGIDVENPNVLNEPTDRSENYKVTRKPRLEADPLHLASDPNDYDNDGSKFEDLGTGLLRMRIKVVPQKAYAGYMRGFEDPEFYEDLQTVSIDVLKEHRGHYLAFEVRGDSMISTDPDEFEHMALPGWKAVSREVPRHQWKFKLHTHRYDTWIIVHRTEGILIKNIIKHDVEMAQITIHSLNPKYKDEVLDLNDVAQIFSVVKYIVDK